MLGTAQPPSRSFPSDRDGPTPVGYLRLMSLHVEARCSPPRRDAQRAPPDRCGLMKTAIPKLL